ncbi:MAG: GNAT family N-acetyltransferase [Candidatus Binatia bacterium]
MAKTIHIRSLEKGDLAAIVNMEERQTGVARPDYWEQRLEISEAIRPHWASLVAEYDNRVVGFILGRAGEHEFGLPGTVAWVEMIGVDPAYRRRGVADELIEQFTTSAEGHGIKTIFTLIDPNQAELQHFFSRLGFVHGKMVHYQKELAG